MVPEPSALQHGFENACIVGLLVGSLHSSRCPPASGLGHVDIGEMLPLCGPFSAESVEAVVLESGNSRPLQRLMQPADERIAPDGHRSLFGGGLSRRVGQYRLDMGR